MVEADRWSYRRHKVYWFCVYQNSQPCFPPLSSKTRRASRVVPSVHLKNKPELVKLLRRLSLGGASESPAGRAPLSELVPSLKQPREAEAQLQEAIPGQPQQGAGEVRRAQGGASASHPSPKKGDSGIPQRMGSGGRASVLPFSTL